MTNFLKQAIERLVNFKNYILDLTEDQKRITFLKITVASFFIVGILFAKDLWLSDRLYPLKPIFDFLSFVPTWVDYILLPVLIGSLLLTIFSPQPRKYLLITLCLTAFFFLEDQGRIFPGFYECFILLFVIYLGFQKSSSENHRAVLNACRLIVIFIYFWSGVQKINPFFHEQISWVFLPISNLMPFINGTIMYWLAILIPFIEAAMGPGLLFKKTRNIVLVEILLMHGLLFFLIGPIRSNWNNSAWAWNLASAFFVFILFYKAGDVTAKEIVFNKKFKANWVVLIFFGLLPAMSFVNLWYSALSFNVYSGNVVSARIEMTNATGNNLPQELQKYLKNKEFMQYYNKFDIYEWSEDSFNAEPYPEKITFKNIAKYLCGYSTEPGGVRITIHDKLIFLEKRSPLENMTTYECVDLFR